MLLSSSKSEEQLALKFGITGIYVSPSGPVHCTHALTCITYIYLYKRWHQRSVNQSYEWTTCVSNIAYKELSVCIGCDRLQSFRIYVRESRLRTISGDYFEYPFLLLNYCCFREIIVSHAQMWLLDHILVLSFGLRKQYNEMSSKNAINKGKHSVTLSFGHVVIKHSPCHEQKLFVTCCVYLPTTLAVLLAGSVIETRHQTFKGRSAIYRFFLCYWDNLSKSRQLFIYNIKHKFRLERKVLVHCVCP